MIFSWNLRCTENKGRQTKAHARINENVDMGRVLFPVGENQLHYQPVHLPTVFRS